MAGTEAIQRKRRGRENEATLINTLIRSLEFIHDHTDNALITAVMTLRILVVDSDSHEVDSLKEALAAAQIINVEVGDVEDGEQALAYLRGEYPFLDGPRPHVVFLGLNLPGMSSQEFIRELRRDRDHRQLPVAILTTATDHERLDFRLAAAERCYVFKKPTSCDQWMYTLRCIEDVCSLSQTVLDSGPSNTPTCIFIQEDNR
ncbi:MAG: response regulator [Nitrospirae bacterium]|nr:MAG: response regulator [Nitrospirota bacterium]